MNTNQNNSNNFLRVLCCALAMQSTLAFIMPIRRESTQISSRSASFHCRMHSNARMSKFRSIRAKSRGKKAHSKAVANPNSAAPDNFNFTNVNIGTDDANVYVGTIMVAGSPFEVQLDSGSSDLWLDTTGTDVSGFTDTKVPGIIEYADNTSANGPILIGKVQFGDFTVEQQAFISAAGSNATTNGDKGLLGIGPPLLSTINDSLSGKSNKSSGDTPFKGASFLDNVFAQNATAPKFMSFALSRSDQGTTGGGVFTIGEIPENYTDVSSAPKLTVDPKSQQWITSLDYMIVNGKRLTGHSFNPKNERPTALLDSGTGLAMAPPFYVDAIYKSVPGAKFSEDWGGYLVPCDTKVNISFVFANTTYPVHPIDATFITGTENNKPVCLGAFTYADKDDTLDFLLGDTFLRNVYSVFEFGSWTSSSDSDPYMQLLSTTDAADAFAEFETLSASRLDAFKQPAEDNSSDSTGVDSGDSTDNSDNSRRSLSMIPPSKK